MTTIELKSNLYSLIENINDINILSGIYKMLVRTEQNKVGLLWESLSNEQKSELEQLASEDESNLKLISNDEVLKKYHKWK